MYVQKEKQVGRRDQRDAQWVVSVLTAHSHEDLGLDLQNPQKLNVAAGNYDLSSEGQGVETGELLSLWASQPR